MEDFFTIDVRGKDESPNDSSILVLINKDLKKQAQAIALAKNETLSKIVREFIMNYVEKNMKTNKKIVTKKTRKIKSI